MSVDPRAIRDPAGSSAPGLVIPPADTTALPQGEPMGTDVAPGEEAMERQARPDAEADETDFPAGSHCAQAADWDPEWSLFEQRVLELTNAHRAAGAVCGVREMLPVEPLTMNTLLRCSARLHSRDMAVTMYFSHTSEDGREFGERIAATGFDGGAIGENIAWGLTTPEQVVRGWMESSGHCENIMRENFTEIGVGLYVGEAGTRRIRAMYWTQNFGAPRRARRNRAPR